MEKEMNDDELANYVDRQLNNFFGHCDSVYPYLNDALFRVEKCFRVTKNKYYNDGNGKALFSPFHSGQYAVFLYFLSNTIYRMEGSAALATQIYYLNKILHSTDWYYEVELPEYWGVEHPLGSVLGRAKYSNGFFFYQGCTVGGNRDKYPVMGENVILYSNVSILGDTSIGNNVAVSTGAVIKNEVIPSNSVVYGQSPNLIIRPRDKEYMYELISDVWNNIERK